MITDPWFYAAAVPALLLTGLSKSGFVAGAAAMAVPILSLVVSPVQAVGIMLPVLMATDLIGITRYWRQKDAANFRILLVAAVIGSAAGWATAAIVSEAWVRLLVGIIGTLFAGRYWVGQMSDILPDTVARKRADEATVSDQRSDTAPSWPRGLVWGSIAAYASFVSNTAGPPLAVYLLPQRLPNIVYAATAVCVLTCMNWMKVVPYFMLGQLGPANLTTSAVLLPFALAATWLGLWLVPRVPSEPFYRIGYAALLIVSLKLMWDGAWATLTG
jgi:hypothetical protein